MYSGVTKTIRGSDVFAPSFGVFMLILLVARMHGFVVSGQVEVGEIDQSSVEAAVLHRKCVKPFCNCRSDASRPGAGDDGVKFERHGVVLFWCGIRVS